MRSFTSMQHAYAASVSFAFRESRSLDLARVRLSELNDGKLISTPEQGAICTHCELPTARRYKLVLGDAERTHDAVCLSCFRLRRLEQQNQSTGYLILLPELSQKMIAQALIWSYALDTLESSRFKKKTNPDQLGQIKKLRLRFVQNLLLLAKRRWNYFDCGIQLSNGLDWYLHYLTIQSGIEAAEKGARSIIRFVPVFDAILYVDVRASLRQRDFNQPRIAELTAMYTKAIDAICSQ